MHWAKAAQHTCATRSLSHTQLFQPWKSQICRPSAGKKRWVGPKNKVRNRVQNPVALTGASLVRVVMVVRKLPQKDVVKEANARAFDRHAWPRLSALKTHAESAKRNGRKKTTFVGPRFGIQTSDSKTGVACISSSERTSFLAPKFWTPKKEVQPK